MNDKKALGKRKNVDIYFLVTSMTISNFKHPFKTTGFKEPKEYCQWSFSNPGSDFSWENHYHLWGKISRWLFICYQIFLTWKVVCFIFITWISLMHWRNRFIYWRYSKNTHVSWNVSIKLLVCNVFQGDDMKSLEPSSTVIEESEIIRKLARSFLVQASINTTVTLSSWSKVKITN